MTTKYYVYQFNEGWGDTKFYCMGIPDGRNPLSGIQYQAMPDNSIPDNAASTTSEKDAIKVVKYLNRAFYGPKKNHFIEAVEIKEEKEDV